MGEPGQDFRIRFGVFELDTRSGELRKAGTRIRLQDQPLKVLIALLERPGEAVTREELRRRIWPEESFGDFDHAVNVAVGKLRTALADSADVPRFVETLPRRGYRFIFPVTTPREAEPGAVSAVAEAGLKPNKTSTRFRWAAAIAATIVVAGLVVSGWWFFSHKPRVLTETDTIVVADFTNTTGDPVFDGTLRQGLAVELEQSPFLSLVSEKRIRQTLQMMKQQPDAKLTPAIAREICRRISSTAVLDGSITKIGEQYNLILRAEDCSNGESIASTEVQVTDKSHVLAALGMASSHIRKKLGESLASVEKYGTPLEQATTPSLEALQAYDAGYKLADRGDYSAALPFFQQARNLDPNFVLASLLLGMMQYNLVHERDSASNLQRAFDQRSTVSERERLFIEVEYYQTKGGQDAEDALDVSAALWVKTYPRDCTARGELGGLYAGREQFDKALPEIQQAHRLCPGDGLISAGLISVYTSLNRFAEARAVSEEPRAKEVDSFEVHTALYRLAFLQNDTAAMEREVAFAAGKPGLEDQLWYSQANTAAYYGRMKDSREFSRKAVGSAFEAGENERAVLDAEIVALREAYVGNMTEARRQLSAALRLPNAANAGSWVVLELFAILGEEGDFKPLAEKYAKENAEDRYARNIQLPAWMAELALARHDAPAALEALRPRPYESRFHCPDTTYVRGLAYLANRQGKEAAAEFQKMIDYRVLLSNAPQSSLARLQLGRAFALQGDTAKARAAYQDFFTLWKGADPDIPILIAAKSEYTKLK